MEVEEMIGVEVQVEMVVHQLLFGGDRCHSFLTETLIFTFLEYHPFHRKSEHLG